MPPPVLVSAATTLDALAVGVPGLRPGARRAFWPGPLTIVCRQQSSLQWDLGETRGTVAVRMPDHEVALALLERTGPLAVSSANLTGRPPARDADEAEEMLGGRRRGRSSTAARPRGGEASTIVDCTGSAGPDPAPGRALARRAQRRPRAARASPSRTRASHLMREYLLVFLVAGTVTYLLTVIAREIALRTGAVAAVRDRDVHAVPIPYLGGSRCSAASSAAYLVARELPFLSPQRAVRLPRRRRGAGRRRADLRRRGARRHLRARRADQARRPGARRRRCWSYFDVQFYFFPRSPTARQFILDPAQGALLTVVVVVATINAVNFVDGLDGLAAGVVGIGAVAFFVFCYVLRRSDRTSPWPPRAPC